MDKKINDPRVVKSEGGGISPEQHWGELADGSVFYFRMRWGWSELKVGPPGTDISELPLTRPGWDAREARVAFENGKPYPSFFLGPIGEYNIYPDEQYAGSFHNQEDRDRAFTACLDQIWKGDGVDYTTEEQPTA